MTGFRFPASLALFVLTAVDAQARPGMGGSYEAGSSGSTYSSPSSSSGASSSSSFSEPSFPTTPTPSPPVGSYTPPTPTADELRNAEYDALTASASLHALELSISPEGRFLVREVLDFHDPKSENKRGVRYAAPFHMPRYWWPVDAAVVPVGGFLSGTFGDDAAEKIPIQVESQRLIASRGPSPYAVAYFAWAAPNPDSQPAAPRPDQFVAEMELLPGSKFAKDGDHLALIYALPQCAECEDTTIALRLRSPGQRPNATWRVVEIGRAHV